MQAHPAELTAGHDAADSLSQVLLSHWLRFSKYLPWPIVMAEYKHWTGLSFRVAFLYLAFSFPQSCLTTAGLITCMPEPFTFGLLRPLGLGAGPHFRGKLASDTPSLVTAHLKSKGLVASIRLKIAAPLDQGAAWVTVSPVMKNNWSVELPPTSATGTLSVITPRLLAVKLPCVFFGAWVRNLPWLVLMAEVSPSKNVGRSGRGRRIITGETHHYDGIVITVGVCSGDDIVLGIDEGGVGNIDAAAGVSHRAGNAIPP
jgi:hypothetical protein